MTFAIRINARVVEVFERKRKIWISGTGQDAVFNEVSDGWFVRYEGSFEALHVGEEKPDLAVGDTVTISFRKG